MQPKGRCSKIQGKSICAKSCAPRRGVRETGLGIGCKGSSPDIGSQAGFLQSSCGSLSRTGASGAAGLLLQHIHCLAAGAAGGTTLGSTAVPLCALSRFDLGVWALPPFMEGFLHQRTQSSRCRLPGHSANDMQRNFTRNPFSCLPQTLQERLHRTQLSSELQLSSLCTSEYSLTASALAATSGSATWAPTGWLLGLSAASALVCLSHLVICRGPTHLLPPRLLPWKLLSMSSWKVSPVRNLVMRSRASQMG